MKSGSYINRPNRPLQVYAAVFLIVIALALMLALSWQLTIVALLVMPVLIIASRSS